VSPTRFDYFPAVKSWKDKPQELREAIEACFKANPLAQFFDDRDPTGDPIRYHRDGRIEEL
jgi:hypothetical protein